MSTLVPSSARSRALAERAEPRQDGRAVAAGVAPGLEVVGDGDRRRGRAAPRARRGRAAPAARTAPPRPCSRASGSAPRGEILRRVDVEGEARAGRARSASRARRRRRPARGPRRCPARRSASRARPAGAWRRRSCRRRARGRSRCRGRGVAATSAPDVVGGQQRQVGRDHDRGDLLVDDLAHRRGERVVPREPAVVEARHAVRATAAPPRRS